MFKYLSLYVTILPKHSDIHNYYTRNNNNFMVPNIDFSINGLCAENRLRSQRSPSPYKIKVKNYKLIDLVRGIELTQAILLLRFSTFLRIPIIYFGMFLYLVICFLRVAVSLLCRLQAVSKKHVPMYSYLISEGRRNCSNL